MRQRVINNRFIGDLTKLDLRQCRPSVRSQTAGRLATASLIELAVSAGYRQIDTEIRRGDLAQTLRDREKLEQVAENIRRAAPDAKALAIADHYSGLALCRQGPGHYEGANRLFANVIETAPDGFRPKALVALGTNLAISGDEGAAKSIHAEAARVAETGGKAVAITCFHVGMSRTFVCLRKGDNEGALRELERIVPIARNLARDFPALLHHCYNNLACTLVALGRLEDAKRVAAFLQRSPYLDLYPESRRTCEDIDRRTRKPSRTIVVVGEPFTGVSDNPMPGTPPLQSLADRQPQATEFANPQHAAATMEALPDVARSLDRQLHSDLAFGIRLTIPFITFNPAIKAANLRRIRIHRQRGRWRENNLHWQTHPARGPPGGKNRVQQL